MVSSKVQAVTRPGALGTFASHGADVESAFTGQPMTDEQALALARLMRGRANSNVNIIREPFDLPTGYLLVTFVIGGFTCGIAPDGSVSS